MKRWPWLRTTIALACVATALVVKSGGYDLSGGGDRLKPEHNAAWFSARHEVRYCLKLDPQFPVAAEVAEATFRDVAQTWRDYAARKHVELPLGELRGSPVCTGDEDLTIYLGADDALVRSHREKYDDPIGFAERTSFDVARGLGRGFIWIAPSSPRNDWSLPGRLFGALLHEFGHALGCEHISGTIMTADIAAVLFAQSADPREDFRRIDQNVELALCKDCTVYRYPVFIGGEKATATERAQLFARLTGRAPSSRELTAEFVRRVEAQSAAAPRISLAFEISDGSRVTKFPLEFHDESARAAVVDLGASLFKTVARANGTLHVSEHRAYAGSFLGTLRSQRGEVLATSVEYNLHLPVHGFLQGKYFDPSSGTYRVLFSGPR